MHKLLNILVTDINPHVRNLLKREFTARGHTVRTAKNVAELLRSLYFYDDLDIIVLDPELPDLMDKSLFKKLKSGKSGTPVRIIVHSYKEFFKEWEKEGYFSFVEKNAVSIWPLHEKINALSN